MADFEGLQIELDNDPAPNSKRTKASATGKNPVGRPPGRPSKSQIEKELKEELEMFLVLGGGLWSTRDNVCGPAFMSNAPNIADAAANIIIDHDKLLKFLTSGGDMMKYIKLAMALKPVIDTVRDHHLGSPADGNMNESTFAPYNAA